MKFNPARTSWVYCEYTHTLKEEHLRAVRRGCGVTHGLYRGSVVLLRVVHPGCGYTHTVLSAEINFPIHRF